jgi:hypothetical protein
MWNNLYLPTREEGAVESFTYLTCGLSVTPRMIGLPGCGGASRSQVAAATDPPQNPLSFPRSLAPSLHPLVVSAIFDSPSFLLRFCRSCRQETLQECVASPSHPASGKFFLHLHLSLSLSLSLSLIHIYIYIYIYILGPSSAMYRHSRILDVRSVQNILAVYCL